MLTQERLRALLEYAPETGEFRWLAPTKGQRVKGKIAGYVHPQGYRHIRIDDVAYSEARLVILYTTGEWPKGVVDHIDGDRANNRLSNIRQASQAQNTRNRKPINGKTLPKGVSRWKWGKYQGYLSVITYEGKQCYLGSFDCPAAAHLAYVVASDKLHGEFGRTR